MAQAMRDQGRPSAMQTIAQQEKARSETGWLVPPPMPLAQLARARVLDPLPGTTTNRQSPELVAMLKWLDDIDAAGGTEADIQKAWNAWAIDGTAARTTKIPQLAKYDQLKKKAAERDAARQRQLAYEMAPLNSARHRALHINAVRAQRREWQTALLECVGFTDARSQRAAEEAKQRMRDCDEDLRALEKMV